MENNQAPLSVETVNFLVARREKTEIRRLASYIGFAYLIMTAIPYVWAVVVSVFASRFGFSADVIFSLTEDDAVQHLLQIVLSSVMFLFPYLLALTGDGRKLSEVVSFKKPNRELILPLIFIAVGFCAFANIATNSISAFFSLFGIPLSAPEMPRPDGLFGLILMFLSISVTPALVEEFAMRGVVLGTLRRFGDGFAIAVSSVIFAMVHCNFVQIPFAFMVGVALSFAVIKTGSIWTGVIIHFFNNFFSLCLDTIFEYVPSMVEQTIITSVYFALCFTCFFIGLVMLRNKKNDIWKTEEPTMITKTGNKLGIFFSSPIIIVDIIITVIISVTYIFIS